MPNTTPTPDPSCSPWRASGHPAAIAIIIGLLLMVALMATHPAVHTNEPVGYFRQMEEMATLNAVVHGVAIGAAALLVFGFLGLSQRLGLGRTAVRGALISYTLGSLALIAAASVNGFIVPGVVLHHAEGADPVALFDRLRPVLALCQWANGTCSRIGVISWSVAVALWSIALLRPASGESGGALARALGVLGLLCGGAPVVALAFGALPMNVHGFGAFVLVQTVWGLGVGVWAMRR